MIARRYRYAELRMRAELGANGFQSLRGDEIRVEEIAGYDHKVASVSRGSVDRVGESGEDRLPEYPRFFRRKGRKRRVEMQIGAVQYFCHISKLFNVEMREDVMTGAEYPGDRLAQARAVVYPEAAGIDAVSRSDRGEIRVLQL